MICSHCRDVVLDIARGVANPDEAAALDHVHDCTECRRHLQRQRELTLGLQALRAWDDEVPSEALERQLLAALKVGAVNPNHEPAPADSRLGRGDWMKIAAMIVLVASATLAWYWFGKVGRTGSTREVQATRPVLPAASAQAPVIGSSNLARPITAADPPSALRPRTDQRSDAKAERPHIVQAAGFVALPAAAMLPPFERGEIVRVQIRFASLPNLGFAVQPDAIDDTPVNADLLVGQDGQPRAIRLVTTATQEPRSRR
jgi:hypothetical protein